MNNYLKDENVPEILRKFLIYTQTIQGKSEKTIQEYFFDLRLYFRFLIRFRNGLDIDVNEIDISNVEIEFIKMITLEETYEFLFFLASERVKFHKSTHSPIGISASSRSRKISSIRTFFKYLVDKTHVLDVNPVANLDFPKTGDVLPKFLTLTESERLIQSIDGQFRERDLSIILIFLTCGLRVSELVGINLNHIKENSLTVLGKGNKERVVYLNSNCLDAINEYLKVRLKPNIKDEKALFISRQGNRINVQTVKWLVKKYALNAGVDRDGISAHKLRHTAATLMYSSGVDIRTLQEVLGHKDIQTTKIYTHITDSDLQSAAVINPISNININKKKTETS